MLHLKEDQNKQTKDKIEVLRLKYIFRQSVAAFETLR